MGSKCCQILQVPAEWDLLLEENKQMKTNKKTQPKNHQWLLLISSQAPLWSRSPLSSAVSCRSHSMLPHHPGFSWNLLINPANKSPGVKKKNHNLIRPREWAAETRLDSRLAFPGLGFSQHTARLSKGSICGKRTSILAEMSHSGKKRKTLRVSPFPNALWVTVLLKCIACKTHTEKISFWIDVQVVSKVSQAQKQRCWWVRICFLWC